MINSNGEVKMMFADLRVAFTMSPLSVEVIKIFGDSAEVRCLRYNKVFFTDRNKLENIRIIAWPPLQFWLIYGTMLSMTNNNNNNVFSERFTTMRDFISTAVSAFAAFVCVTACAALMTFPIWGLMLLIWEVYGVVADTTMTAIRLVQPHKINNALLEP